GGAVFYPEGTAQLGEIFDRINRELRTQYRLGYYPTPRGPADTYRTIEVSVVSPSGEESARANSGQAEQPGGYSVRHRKSYYTGQP
ncbi:MAG TPA: hypothetical protein VKB24_01010, partial [Candidatus Acidoferrum sp.]|nr:hypothetical protein [Candidatus Acidoferrum sp.]